MHFSLVSALQQNNVSKVSLINTSRNRQIGMRLVMSGGNLFVSCPVASSETHWLTTQTLHFNCGTFVEKSRQISLVPCAEMFPRRPSSQVSLANRSIVSASIRWIFSRADGSPPLEKTHQRSCFHFLCRNNLPSFSYLLSVSRSQGLLGTPDTSFSPSPGWKSPTFRPPTSFRHSMSSLLCSPP